MHISCGIVPTRSVYSKPPTIKRSRFPSSVGIVPWRGLPPTCKKRRVVISPICGDSVPVRVLLLRSNCNNSLKSKKVLGMVPEISLKSTSNTKSFSRLPYSAGMGPLRRPLSVKKNRRSFSSLASAGKAPARLLLSNSILSKHKSLALHSNPPQKHSLTGVNQASVPLMRGKTSVPRGGGVRSKLHASLAA